MHRMGLPMQKENERKTDILKSHKKMLKLKLWSGKQGTSYIIAQHNRDNKSSFNFSLLSVLCKDNNLNHQSFSNYFLDISVLFGVKIFAIKM